MSKVVELGMKVNPKKIAGHQRLICSAAFNGMRDHMMREGKECSITLNSGSVSVSIIEGDFSYVYAMPVRLKNVKEAR